MDPWMLACALYCFAFAVFHMLFWKLFDWPNELQKTGAVTRAITQILNLRLIYVFLAVGVICLAYPHEMRTTPVGRALLIGMSCFWAGRLAEQFIFMRVNKKSVHVLSVLFFAGMLLFLLPALL
jgi:hypothetical protein